MRYLDFEAPDAGFGKGLDEADIVALCAFADTQGNRAMVDRLGTEFPNSAFGKAANPDPDGFWHGTAVADLAAGVEPGRPRPSRFLASNCPAP